jgi:hypothetical protein
MAASLTLQGLVQRGTSWGSANETDGVAMTDKMRNIILGNNGTSDDDDSSTGGFVNEMVMRGVVWQPSNKDVER